MSPEIQEILTSVKDPEIPVLSIMDMGVVRKVEASGEEIHVDITPTYSGCPAMDTIATDIKRAFSANGYQATVKLVLSPAWTTDWITEEGRAQLKAYGIAPPMGEAADKMALLEGAKVVPCPRCQSTQTQVLSPFGSTACKALFQCKDCLETFDYFKCLR